MIKKQLNMKFPFKYPRRAVRRQLIKQVFFFQF